MSEPEIAIRAVGAGPAAATTDARRLALVGGATFLETYADSADGHDLVAHCAHEHTEARYRELLGGADARAWLAEVVPGGAPIGYLLMTRPDLPDAHAGDLEVRRLYVLHPYQGRRVGVRLMNEAIAVAHAVGARRLLLGAYAQNVGALAFYTRCGFRRVGTREFRVGGTPYLDHVLARELD